MNKLSTKTLERIARIVIADYYRLPAVRGTIPDRIDPELLTRDLLGLRVEYHRLSADLSILGLTTFEKMEIQFFDSDSSQDNFCFLDGRTVFVESQLKDDPRQIGRYRFTLMHEGCHHILNRLFPFSYGINNPERNKLHFYRTCDEQRQQITDWEEWQTNTLAAAILMPEDLIDRAMFRFDLGEKIGILCKILYRDVYLRFCCMAEYLGVSKKALAIRLKQLGRLKQEYLERPYDLISVCYE